MYSVNFKFKTKAARDRFVGYMSDGGGEWSFFESEANGETVWDEETDNFKVVAHADEIGSFDYDKKAVKEVIVTSKTVEELEKDIDD